MADISDIKIDPPTRRVIFLGAFLLIIIPFVQSGSQLWPLQLSNIQWRFGAANALSSVLLLPYLGLGLVFVLSRATGSRGLARVVGAFSVLLTVAIAGGIALFVLDGLQLKKVVNSTMMNSFNLTTIRVGVVTTLFLFAFALLALSCFSSPKIQTATASKKSEKKPDDEVGLIVGR